jgi:boron transporter
VAGLLGLPFPNGLIPQAPFHTDSLCVTKVVASDDSSDGGGAARDEGGDNKGHGFALRRTHVVEQRVSNLAQGLLTLGTMSGPLLVVLHLIPQGVLAGLFFIMGYQALAGNGITAKLLFLLRDRRLTPPSHPLRALAARRPLALPLFVALELLGFGVTFAITQTVAAVGFPVCILALIPVRAALLPRLFAPADLALLDEPTASPFTMESVGGAYGEAVGERDEEGESATPDEAEDDKEKMDKAGGGVLHGRLSDDELAERGQAKSSQSAGGGESVVMGRVPTGGSGVSRRSHGRNAVE